MNKLEMEATLLKMFSLPSSIGVFSKTKTLLLKVLSEQLSKQEVTIYLPLKNGRQNPSSVPILLWTSKCIGYSLNICAWLAIVGHLVGSLTEMTAKAPISAQVSKSILSVSPAYELHHNKTCYITCPASIESDLPMHQQSLITAAKSMWTHWSRYFCWIKKNSGFYQTVLYPYNTIMNSVVKINLEN